MHTKVVLTYRYSTGPNVAVFAAILTYLAYFSHIAEIL